MKVNKIFLKRERGRETGGKERELGRHTDKRRNCCRFGNANVSKSRRKLCIRART